MLAALTWLVGCAPLSTTPPDACRVDGDCSAGRVCEDGHCRPGPERPDTGVPIDASHDGGRDAGARDGDRDGLSDDDELLRGTDPGDRDSDDDGLDDGDEVARGTDPLASDTDGDGIPDGSEVYLGIDPTTPDEACAGTSAAVTLTPIPIDIIIAIDSSSSMDGEIAAVERHLDERLAAILDAAGVDYHVILVGSYPEICIAAPLSDAPDCTTAPRDVPMSGPRFFHYDQFVGSNDALQLLVETYQRSDEHGTAPDGWGALLRDGARRVFLVITDDESWEAADSFDRQLLMHPEHFGEPGARDYVFHAIIGMVPNTPPEAPWPPSAPLQTATCSPGAEAAGLEYQKLAVVTGGLRFPLCDNDSFDAIFEHLATDVVASSIGCRLEPGRPPGGESPDFSRVVVLQRSDSGVRALRPVTDESACGGGDFWVEDDAIQLCPDSCERIGEDPSARLEAHVACEQRCGDGTLDPAEECDDGNREDGDGCSATCTIELD